MIQPSCSVIIPVRDCLAYLRVAIESVRYQHGVDLEVIVVDDGSSDGAWEWLSHQAREDARLRPIRLEGVGPARARNAGIEAARGDLIAFLDADDQWWPGKLARQVAHHRAAPQTAFSFTDYLHVDPEGGVHGGCFAFWKPHFANGASLAFQRLADPEYAILECNTVGTSTVVASRKALQNANGFAESKSAEDWDLWLRLAGFGEVAFSLATTATYMMRPGSETRNASARIEAMQEIIERYGSHSNVRAAQALRGAQTRLLLAHAEEARARGAFGVAALLHARAFLGRKDLRTLRAAASDVRASLRQGQRSAAS